MKCPDLHRKALFSSPPCQWSWSGWESRSIKMFMSNCMKYPDLFGLVILDNLHLIEGGNRVFSGQNVLLGMA